MTINFANPLFIWLLPLTTSSTVTFGQNHNYMNVMTGKVGNKFPHDQLTTQEASSLNPLSEEKLTKHSTKSLLQTMQTIPSEIFLANIQTAATPPTSIPSQFRSSTVCMKFMTVQFKVTTSTTSVVTSQANNPTKITRVLSMLWSSTQSQDTGNTLTSQFTSDVENKSTSTSPVTGGEVIQSTGLCKTTQFHSKDTTHSN